MEEQSTSEVIEIKNGTLSQENQIPAGQLQSLELQGSSLPSNSVFSSFPRKEQGQQESVDHPHGLGQRDDIEPVTKPKEKVSSYCSTFNLKCAAANVYYLITGNCIYS